MVSSVDRAMGIVERTSAEAGVGHWIPGMETDSGFLWAATVGGEKVIAFETAPGQVAFGLTPETLLSARKVAAGLNIVVEAEVKSEDSEPLFVTIIGPRGRVKRIFAFLNFPL